MSISAQHLMGPPCRVLLTLLLLLAVAAPIASPARAQDVTPEAAAAEPVDAEEETPPAEQVMAEPTAAPVEEPVVEEPVVVEPPAEPVVAEPPADPVVEALPTEPATVEPPTDPVVEEPVAGPVEEPAPSDAISGAELDGVDEPLDGDDEVSASIVAIEFLLLPPPVAGDDAATTAEDTAVVVSVLANDSDAGGNPLSITAATDPAKGAAAVNPDGTITYTSDADTTGADTFDYTLSDGYYTDTATVSITVAPVNDPPVSRDDNAKFAEDTAFDISVLGNDRDPDGDQLEVAEIVTSPSNGTILLAAPGGPITYTPNADFNGGDTFTYRAGDGVATGAVATVNIIVLSSDDAPVALDDAYTTTRDTTLTVPPPSVTANDSDVDGDEIVGAFVQRAPANGAAVIEYTRQGSSLEYTPGPGFVGVDSFTYQVKSSGSFGNVATVTITVTAANSPPVVVDDTAATAEDTPVLIPFGDLVADDTDADGDQLSFGGAEPGSMEGGTVQVAGGGVLYSPPADFSGVDTFRYAVSDGTVNAAGTVTVTVAPVNDAPVANDDTATTAEETAVAIDVLLNDTDVEGDGIAVRFLGRTSNGSLWVDVRGGPITYTPNRGFVGTDSFTYAPSDGSGRRGNDATVTITVTRLNRAPAAVDDAATTAEDTAVDIDVLANDQDADGDPLTVAIDLAPARGTVAVGAAGVVTYTPDPNANGPDAFTYQVSDGISTDTATVDVTVTPVNDLPTAGDDSATTTAGTPVDIDVHANDFDPDGDRLAVGPLTQPSNGGLAIPVRGGPVTYTPDPGFVGTDTFTYAPLDGSGSLGNLAIVTIAVTLPNIAPLAGDDAMATAEDTAVTVDLLANDTDTNGDALRVTAISNPAKGTATVNADDTVTYTPDADANGADSFTYTVSDGALTDTATVSITVTPVNDPPVAVDDAITVAEDSGAAVVDVLANDATAPDAGETLTITAVTQPATGLVTLVGGIVRFSPATDDTGAKTFTYTVSDGNGGADTATVAVTVSPVADAPVAVGDAYTTAEDTRLVVAAPGLLGNDTDADGDTLTVTGVTQPAAGAVVRNGTNGAFTFTPDADVTGVTTFTYDVSDGIGGVDTATVTITVTGVNDAPVAAADTAVTDEDTAVVVAVLANDGDPDRDSLVLSSVAQPAHGTAVANSNGTVTYTPDAGSSGPDAFAYTVSDGSGAADTATVSVAVNPVNDGPDAVDDAATTAEDTAVKIDVLANDTDPESDALTVTDVTDPANGSATVDPDGSVTYTPRPDYAGVDTFTYTANDPTGDASTATVLVTVSPVNDAPVAADDVATTDEDVPVAIAVLSNDADVEGDPLVVTIVSAPANGAAVVQTDGTVTYAPDRDFAGTDAFSYGVDDGQGGTGSATVTVTVLPIPDEPMVVDDTATVDEDDSVVVDVLANDGDPDGDPLAVASAGPAANGSVVVNPDGTITYTPNPDVNGTDTFPYTVVAGAQPQVVGAADSESFPGTVTVTVRPVDDAPVAVDDDATTREGVPVAVDVLANDTHPDGDPLTVAEITVEPSNGVAEIVDGAVAYTPAPDYSGTDSLAYQVTDEDGDVAEATLTITIVALPVRDADEDGVADVLDICPDDADPGQEDADGDGTGDACDETPDGDPTPEATSTPTVQPTSTPLAITLPNTGAGQAGTDGAGTLALLLILAATVTAAAAVAISRSRRPA